MNSLEKKIINLIIGVLVVHQIYFWFFAQDALRPWAIWFFRSMFAFSLLDFIVYRGLEAIDDGPVAGTIVGVFSFIAMLFWFLS